MLNISIDHTVVPGGHDIACEQREITDKLKDATQSVSILRLIFLIAPFSATVILFGFWAQNTTSSPLLMNFAGLVSLLMLMFSVMLAGAVMYLPKLDQVFTVILFALFSTGVGASFPAIILVLRLSTIVLIVCLCLSYLYLRDKKILEASLAKLEAIELSDCPEILSWCQHNDVLAQYQNHVANQERSLIKLEQEAMLQWLEPTGMRWTKSGDKEQQTIARDTLLQPLLLRTVNTNN